jgi:cytochrome c-type biogenesis protein CcmF
MTEAAIDTGFTRDLYVSLGEPVDGGAWIVRVYVKPFVDWIWGGCLIMALGGVLAAVTAATARASAPRKASAGSPPERPHEEPEVPDSPGPLPGAGALPGAWASS